MEAAGRGQAGTDKHEYAAALLQIARDRRQRRFLVARNLGMFVTTMPLRIRLDDSHDFWQATAQIQSRQTICRQYGYTSLAEIQRQSPLPAGVPLFDNIVIFENYPSQFSDAEEFLAAYSIGSPGCVVAEFRLLGMNGLRLQECLVLDCFSSSILQSCGTVPACQPDLGLWSPD